MKIIKAFTSALMVILVVFGSIYTAFAAVYIEDWGFRFEKKDIDSSYEINKYIGDDTDVVIPNRYNGFLITSIGEYAFINTSVTSVSLGSNITEIKNGAFINVSGLSEIILNENLTTIGNYAFAGCTGLSTITIPDSVTDISDTAFLNCENIVIYCHENSYAQQYAEANEIDCVVLYTFILGDTDGDEDITIRDATIIQRILVEMIDDTDGIMSLRGDVSQDGLDIDDVTMIQRFLVGLSSGYSIGEEITRTLP